MEYYKKWSEERWLLLSWRKSWTLREFREMEANPWSWVLSILFDGFNEPGDPSGFHIVLFGTELEIYWPMYRCVSWQYSLFGGKPRLVRWEMTDVEKSLLP